MCIRGENCSFINAQYKFNTLHTETENSSVTIKRNQSNFIPHKPFYDWSGKKKLTAFTMWFYFNEMLAYSRKQWMSSRLLKNVFWGELVFIFFSACTGVAGMKSQQVPLRDLTQSLSCSALFLPAHGAFWMSPKKRGHLAEMPSDDIIWVWATKLFELFFSVTLHPRPWTKTLIKCWNKEFCCLATASQGPGMQKTLPFYFFSIRNSL